MSEHSHPAPSERRLTPEERRWIKRLQRVLDGQPHSIVVYCHGQSATVLDGPGAREAGDWDRRAAIIDDAPGITCKSWIAGDF